MKRTMKTWALVAVAAMGLTACQNDFEEQVEAKDSVVVTFVADSADTRTSVDTSGEKPEFAWGESETFAVLEQTDALAEATSVTFEKVDGKANITAEFATNAGKGSYSYVTVYPASGYVSAESIDAATLTLPAEQTMANGSYDPNADLMVSEVKTTNAQPTEAQKVGFHRIAAVVEMTINNLAIGVGEQIEKVEFIADGKALAGTITADLNVEEGAPTYDVAEGVSSVSVATTASDVVYFTVLPTTLTAGDAYSVAIVTNKYLYIKQGTIPADKSLAFVSGKVTRFGVNMSGVNPSDKWVLVDDVTTLKDGDVVTFAAQKFNRVMGAKSFTNYPFASDTEIVKAGDYLYHPISDKNATMIQELIVDKVGENTFNFFNALNNYDGDTKTGYLCTASSNGTGLTNTNKQLKLLAYPNNNTLFTVTIAEDGVATIIAEGSEYDNKYVQYVDGSLVDSDYNYFKCLKTEGEATEDTAICLYKLEGAEPVEIPTPGANITVSSSSTALVIEKEGVQEETKLDKVKFNYVGDWDIEVSAKEKNSEDVADWLSIYYDAEDACIYYTVAENKGTVRYATVTVTATHADEEEIVKSFEVVQKGGPQEITIEEFITKAADVNITYKITGKVTEVATSLSKNYVIEDANGNKAKIYYLKTEDGDTVAGNGDINLDLGDVVTVTTIVVSSKGSGGNSTYPSVYVGHYNISATATPNLVGYEGGNVAITINKLGTMEPETIVGGMSGDATFSHEDGAYSANVEFEENTGAPREVIVTFTSGLATAEVAIAQLANPEKGLTWELVTDASTLKEGDKVIIAAKELGVAMGEPNTSDSRQAVTVDMIANGRFLIPAVGVQSFVLKAGTAENTFAFYDTNSNGFLVSTAKSGSSYYLKNQSYPNDNTYFTVGETISNPAGDYKGNILYYHDTKDLFYSGTTAKEVAYLYKLAGGSGTIPTIDAVVSVPNADKYVSIEADATVVATAIDDVEFIYTDGWEISASANKDWLNITYTNGKLYYTAEANDSAFRDAVVTIYATRDSVKKELGTFNVRQKGAPMEISIANFIAKTVAETDVTYKLTGVVSALSTSNTGAFKLKDGNDNEVQITYLKTQDGSAYVYNNKDVDLKVGDVVTVYTVLTGTVTTSTGKYGKGGSSTYPSYYQGRYRLTSTVTSNVTYEGGDVTIGVEIETDGDIVAPTTVSAERNDANGALTSYNFDGSTANLTFGENTTSNSRSAGVTFTAGMAIVPISIMQDVAPEMKAGGWWLVLDADELQAGDQVIIAATGMDYAIINTTTTSASSFSSTAITKNGNKLETPSSSVQIFEIGKDGELYTFKGTLDKIAGRYLYASSKYSNAMKSYTTLDNNGKFTIDIDADGAATIVAQGANTYNQMQYNNGTTSAPAFYCTNGSKGAVCLYKYYE